MEVFPDFEGLSGIEDLREVAGALLMFVLIVAVLMLIVSGVCWAIGSSNGNYQLAGRGRPRPPFQLAQHHRRPARRRTARLRRDPRAGGRVARLAQLRPG